VHRRLLLTGLLVLLVAAGAGAWLAVQARQVRADLVAVQDLAPPLERAAREGDSPALGPLQRHAARAARTTRGPLWGLAVHLPVVGGDVAEVRRAARAADLLASRAAPSLVAALDAVHGQRLLHDGQVDLQVLAALQQDVATARRATLTARGDLARLAGHGTVRRQAGRLRNDVVRLDDALATAANVLAQAPAMLGKDAPRRYLVAVQNNAEARATGGLVGVVGLVSVDRGRVTLVRTLTDDQLHNAPAAVPSDPAAAPIWTGVGSTLAWFDTNLTPHVPDAARNLAGLWRAQFGQQVDGVVLLDAVVMQHLLVQPVTLGSTTLRPGDVVDWVAHREYVEQPVLRIRKALLRELSDALVTQVLHLRSVQPVLDAAKSGHLFVWSAHPNEQALLTGHLLGGALPTDGAPYLEVLTQNFGGNKLDYYLQRQVSVRRDGDAYAVTLTLTNAAPDGLPAYMAGRADHPKGGAGYAQARVGLSFYAGKGARFERVLVDGTSALTRFDTDHGLTLATTILELPRGATMTVTTRVHMAGGLLTYRQQPLPRPDGLDLGLPHRVIGT
jgi:hypothetical protein